MADIDVERKSGPPIWMWLLGLLLLALIIWLVASMMGRDDRTAVVPADTTVFADTPMATGPATAPMTLQAFQRECQLDEGQRVDAMGMDHEFTVNCLEQLAASIEEVSRDAPAAQVQRHTTVIRERAQQIRASEPESPQHANLTREAATAAADALEEMQRTTYAGDTQVQQSVAQAREAATGVERTELQLEQLSELRTFFRRAGDALQQMAQRRQV